MERNTDPTRAIDPFGTGEDGFTDGDATMGIPRSIVGAAIMNNFQEEIARAVEGSGQVVQNTALDQFFQLDDAINGMAALQGAGDLEDFSNARAVIGGLRVASTGASLNVQPEPGQFVFDGRRFVITQSKLDAAGHDDFLLVASRDNYLYISSELPGAPGINRNTVHIEQLDVVIGASAPLTPADTFPFARLTTDGSGVTASAYPNHHIPFATQQNGTGVQLRRGRGTSFLCSLVPDSSSGVHLGLVTSIDFGDQSGINMWRSFASQHRYLRSTASGLNPGAIIEEYTRHATTLGSSDTTAIILYDDTDYDDGTVIEIECHATALNEFADASGYAARSWFMVVKSAGAWNLNGSGLAEPEREDGNGAIGAGVTMFPQISGDNLTLLVTGHSGASDILRWFVDFKVNISSPGNQSLPDDG